MRTFADWDDDRPGFLEVDLVAHRGDSTRGEYINTLNMTHVATGWTPAQRLLAGRDTPAEVKTRLRANSARLLISRQ